MKTKNITLIAIFIALLSIFAQLSLPIGPVPITLQTFIVLLIGALLPPKDAILTTTLYLFLGIIGFPIFTGFKGGPHTFLLPTFGFILSWIPATAIQSLFLRKFKRTKQTLVLSFILNTFITYLIGLFYMALILVHVMQMEVALMDVLWLGFLPFLLGDLLKITTAFILVNKLEKVIQRYYE